MLFKRNIKIINVWNLSQFDIINDDNFIILQKLLQKNEEYLKFL